MYFYSFKKQTEKTLYMLFAHRCFAIKQEQRNQFLKSKKVKTTKKNYKKANKT